MGQDKTGWAIIGTGSVAGKFALGLATANGRVASVGSRDPERGRAFLAGLPESLRMPDAVVGDPATAITASGADAVYVATPPSLHETHALLALAARKAVLIEKPLASDAESAARIAAAARAAGVFCMEALWTRFMPLPQWLRDKIAGGDLGEVRAFQAEFMGSDKVDPSQSLFDPALGGGALLHRAVYPISLALSFLGPVAKMTAVGRTGSTGVEEDVTLVLTHHSGALSTLRASLRAGGANGMIVSGTDASLYIDPPVYRPFRARVVRHGVRTGGTGGGQSVGGRLAQLREGSMGQALRRLTSAGPLAALLERGAVSRPYAGNGYGHQAAEVARALQSGQTESPLMLLDDSIATLQLIDRARALIRDERHEV